MERVGARVHGEWGLAVRSQRAAARRSARLQGDRIVLVAHAVVTVAVAAIWPVSRILDLPAAAMVRPLALTLLLLTAWVVRSWRLVGRTLFDPYGMFMLAAVLFNGGQAFLEVFGLNENGILDGHFAPDTIARALAIVISALAALHLGALLAVLSVPPEARSLRVSATTDDRVRSCRIVGLGLLLISVLPAAMVAKERLTVVYQSGYFALYQGEHATGMGGANEILASFLGPGVLFLLAGSGTRWAPRVLSLGIVALYILSNLFAGFRGFAAMLGAAYAWVWHRRVRRLSSPKLLVAGALTLFVVFPVVGAIRNIEGIDRTSLPFLRRAFLSIDNPMVASVSEMGGSLAPLAYTLELVPATRSFEYGAGYLSALSTAVPNLFWDLHPAVARGTPSDWLIWTVDPITAKRGGGLGFSFIAEAYLNFGSAGVPFVTLVVGFLWCRFVLWADDGGTPARIAAIASFTAFTLAYARGEASFIVRPLLWFVLGPYVAVGLIERIRAARWHVHGRRGSSPAAAGTPHSM
jgi:oligosaccharide repeat unit polymerase